eukprot:gene242-859_t
MSSSSSHRTEYHDKTLAKNALVDRKLKIRISNLDAARNISERDITREQRAVQRELDLNTNTRRMSLSCASSPQSPRSNENSLSKRRASNPAKYLSDDVRMTRLELPAHKDSTRRRSLPDMQNFVLPAINKNKSLTTTGHKQTVDNAKHGAENSAEPKEPASSPWHNMSRRASEHHNTTMGNYGNLSQIHTPSLSPRMSISSLVSSLSNSTNRLQTLKDSEETFCRVKQFLQKLEESKLRGNRSFDRESDDECLAEGNSGN